MAMMTAGIPVPMAIEIAMARIRSGSLQDLHNALACNVELTA
jgi:hypothetical protein